MFPHRGRTPLEPAVPAPLSAARARRAAEATGRSDRCAVVQTSDSRGAADPREVWFPGRIAASMSATRFFRADGVSPIWGVGPGCDTGPVSVGWSPLTSAGVFTVVMLRWITLLRC